MPPAPFARAMLLALCGAVWLGGAPSAVAGDEEVCTVSLGDFDKEPAPISTGSCRWADVAPKAVVAVLEEPGHWHHTFKPVVDGELLRDGRLVQVYRARPFPRRQVTVELTVTDAGEVWRVAWRKARRQEPLPEGLVEIEAFDGWWEVKSDGRGGSVVTHGARFDPGEDIPRVLIQKGTPMQIRRLLRQLRSAVSERVSQR